MYSRWKPYVPVAVRRTRALKKMGKLQKTGTNIQPVEIEGRKIARTFWGEAWCDHLESLGDYENRLPRGRTYVRNGSVCHLELTQGTVKAMVSGSDLYKVTVSIKTLPKRKWEDVKSRCVGQIGSLLELLQGKLSKSIMAVVTDREKGLFPLSSEISLHCTCPDWAVMCKHVAAVLYGVGARLDDKPEMLFLLRGVDHEELISLDADAVMAATAGEGGGRRRIVKGDLKDVFGIEMAEEEASGNDQSQHGLSRTKGTGRTASKTAGKQLAKKKSKTNSNLVDREKDTALKKTGTKKVSRTVSDVRSPTGKTVRELRAKFDMAQGQFAELLGVSVSSVNNWEKKKGRLNLQIHTIDALNQVTTLTKRKAWKRLDDA